MEEEFGKYRILFIFYIMKNNERFSHCYNWKLKQAVIKRSKHVIELSCLERKLLPGKHYTNETVIIIIVVVVVVVVVIVVVIVIVIVIVIVNPSFYNYISLAFLERINHYYSFVVKAIKQQ